MTAAPGANNSYTYDASNRILTANSSTGADQYGYAPDNKRIYVRKPDGTGPQSARRSVAMEFKQDRYKTSMQVHADSGSRSGYEQG